MQLLSSTLLLSASDLTNHLGCRHLTELDRMVAEKRLAKPDWRDPALKLLQERGFRHEENFVSHLRNTGHKVTDLREPADPDNPEAHRSRAEDRTKTAMQAGASHIVQATLRSGDWRGVADVLVRVETPSRIGSWSYEPLDTKLARETKGSTILQLCLYSQLLADIQGRTPEHFHVVAPGSDFTPESFRFEDFGAYYRSVKARLEITVSKARNRDTYPDPVEKCKTCRWWQHCDNQRHDDDHLSLVAGISRLQTEELNRQGVDTLQTFAEAEDALKERPSRGSRESFDRSHKQAKTQLRGRREDRLLHELIPHEPGRGLALLPAPNPGDVFFDIESDRFVEDGGLEYLLGLVYLENGAPVYKYFEGLNRVSEKRAFQDLMDFLMERCERFPEMHIYHYSAYDKAAVARLMGRHGTRETEVDRLLRKERFVDLMAVLKQGIRASVEGYGLKDIEPLIGYTRQTELKRARAALRVVAWGLELGRPEDIGENELAVVRAYNREDCEATADLQRWLEGRRTELETEIGAIPRPFVEGDGSSEGVEEREAEIAEVFDDLTAGLPEDRESWTSEQHTKWLLAHLLSYYRREDKVAFWEYYRLTELGTDDLEFDRHGVSGLGPGEQVSATKTGIPIKRYRYPEQEISMKPGDEFYSRKDVKVGTIAAVNVAERTVDIKHTRATAGESPSAGFVWRRPRNKPLEDAILEFGRGVAALGLDRPTTASDTPRIGRAARDLVRAHAPRFVAIQEDRLRRSGEPILAAAARLASELDHSVLPIQGPPGTGKTYIGARMILDLVRRGKRVGVTAVSHKVIENFLLATQDAAKEEGQQIVVAHRGARLKPLPEGYEDLSSKTSPLEAMDQGKVVGGTAWLWAKPDILGQVDYLFVDEAGQMSLANTLAAGQCARNIVLLGDPQQLEQPQKGSHPEGADVAALVHLLAGADTIRDENGLFLDETWRLHPAVCDYTSEVYYEGRLTAREDLQNQVISGSPRFSGSGLFHIPVPHTGNQSNSPEEVEAVSQIVAELLSGGVTWTDRHGTVRDLSLADILVVAPYNSQVGALSSALPTGSRVGTVDKFQGQEAPIVIYSMTSSSSSDAPRGMSFLYSPNRLNVATSRARCACILVASPAVFEPECRMTDHMKWANGVCRFGELAG